MGLKPKCGFQPSPLWSQSLYHVPMTTPYIPRVDFQQRVPHMAVLFGLYIIFRVCQIMLIRYLALLVYFNLILVYLHRQHMDKKTPKQYLSGHKRDQRQSKADGPTNTHRCHEENYLQQITQLKDMADASRQLPITPHSKSEFQTSQTKCNAYQGDRNRVTWFAKPKIHVFLHHQAISIIQTAFHLLLPQPLIFIFFSPLRGVPIIVLI